MAKDLICIICPRGCHLHIDNDIVTGNSCKRGEIYAKAEVSNPKRTITTTIKLQSKNLERLPVRTNVPIQKSLIYEVMNELNKIKVNAPVLMNQVIVKNILDSGVDIIATREILE